MKHVSRENVGVKELFLDTKGTCFLCLKDLDNNFSRESCQQRINNNEVCLKSLCKYLNISSCSVLRRGLRGSLTKDDLNGAHPCDFSVTLCSACAAIVNKLCDLKRQEEIVKMLLEYHVKLLSQIFEGSEEQRWRELQHKMTTDSENSVEAKLVKQLRNETKIKCMLQLQKASFPKVVLFRTPMLTNDPAELLNDPEPVEEQPTYLMFPEDFPSPKISDESYPSNLVQNILDYQCKKVAKGKNECPFCKVTICDSRIRTYLLNIHPERFLVSMRCPTVSETMFRDCCKHLLTTETTRARTQTKNGIQSISSRAFRCLFCQKVCHSGSDFRVHIVLDHYPQLESKLIRLQETGIPPAPTTSKKFRTGRRKRKENLKEKTWICDFKSGGCGQKFCHKYSLDNHKWRAGQSSKLWLCNAAVDGKECELKFFSNCALARHKVESRHGMAYVQWKCHEGSGGRGRKFVNKQSLIRHRKLSCPQRKHAPRLTAGEELSRRRLVRNSWLRRTCAECGGRKFTSRKTFLQHMKQAHKNDVDNNTCTNESVFIWENVDILSTPGELNSLQEILPSTLSTNMKQDNVEVFYEQNVTNIDVCHVVLKEEMHLD